MSSQMYNPKKETRQCKKRSFAGRKGRPIKVKRLQETLNKNESTLQQLRSEVATIKKTASKAVDRSKVMER